METKILITFLPVELWKIENASNALIDFVKDISMQNVECTNYFLITCEKNRELIYFLEKKKPNYLLFKLNFKK